MNANGKELITLLCKKLQYEDEPLTDSNILMVLRELDNRELSQLINFGYVSRWEQEKLSEEKSKDFL